MYKIIGADGREYGPVALETIQQWIRDRRADGNTRVLPEGATEWTTLGQLQEFAASLQASPPPLAPPPPPMPSGSPVLGATAAGDPGPTPLPPDVAARDVTLGLGDAISQAWALVTGPKMGMVIGGVAVWIAVQIGISLFAQIPILGLLVALASLVVGPALQGGLYAFMLRCVRGQQAEVGNIFDGLRYQFGQLFLGGLLVAVLAIGTALPGIALGVAGGIMVSQHTAMPAAIALITVGTIAMLVPLVYLSVCWAFTLPLIMDKRLEFWDAMKLSRAVIRKHWWRSFAFLFVVGLVTVVGVFACFIGYFFTLPLGTAAMCYGYEKLFSDPTPEKATGSTPIALTTL